MPSGSPPQSICGMPAIEIRNLTKRYGGVTAVDDLSFDVEPGRVTGFLGPNGAGKTTTLRALLGLVRPTSGTATFGGRPYHELDAPTRHVGAVLEDASFHPGRTARDHLRVLAVAGRHPRHRVEEALARVDLVDAADRRVKGFSLGMRQRLAIAAALLGDPAALVLDEPTNGLDPPGIAWVRALMRAQAAEGRAVLVSTHVLAEVAQAADDVVVVAGGRLRAAGPLTEVLGGDEPCTEVRAQEPARLAAALVRQGFRVDRDGDLLVVHGAAPDRVGEIAGAERVAVLGLAPRARSLEQAFFALTGAAA
jgi:ABC-2 type transport system ATP-binding protein